MHTCTIGNSLIRVDGFVQFLSVEEVLQEFLDLWDTCGPSDQDNVVDLTFVQLGIPQSLLHRFHGAPEEISVQLLKPSPSDASVKVNTLIQRVDLNAGLRAGGQGPLCPLTGGSETSNSSLVFRDVLFVFTLEFLNEMVDHSVVEVFTTQVSVS